MRLMPSTSAGRSSVRRLLGLYPRWWRDRYGQEMTALLETRPPSARDRIDLARGAFDAHLRTGSGPRSGRAVAAALIAGGAWTIAGVASVGGPTPPDWPGYLASTLPLALVGVVATLIALLAAARLAWSSNGPIVEVTVAATVVGYFAWAGALGVAALGGPYGTVTGIAQSLAAIATVGMGLILLRAGAHPVGEIILVAGTVMLLPTPAGWVVAGALWTGLGLWRVVEARSGDSPRGPLPINR
jgi:hypothetical protein